MGSHASAEVFYGHDLGDLHDRETFEYIGPAWLEDRETDWPDRLAVVRGLVAVPFPSHLFDNRGSADHSHPDYVAWSQYRDRVIELDRESPVELTTYGHSESGDTSWCVQVKASVLHSSYDCVPLDFSETTGPDSQWDLDVAAFVRELELAVSDPPRWYVSSSFG